MKKNIFVAMSSILVLGAVLAGCGSANEASNGNSGQTAPAENTGPKVLKMNLQSEPPTADPGIAEDKVADKHQAQHPA